MKIQISNYAANFIFLIAFSFIISSCEKKGQPTEKDDKYNLEIVINEVMASNHCGLMDDDGKLKGWVELKNIGQESISLKGFRLNDKFKLPKVELAPQECYLVFECKKLKLPKHDGNLQLISPDNTIMSKVQYKHLKADESLSRNNNGEYHKTSMQTPGFENTALGFEEYNSCIEEQRKTSPLLIWEFMTRAEKRSLDWVELRNVTDSIINLKGYQLAKSPDMDSCIYLPEQTLAPGQFLTINLKVNDNETAILMKNGKFMDGVSGRNTYDGVSIGRKSGRKGFFYFNQQTQNANNTAIPYRFIAKAPTFSKQPGVYNMNTSVSVMLNSGERPIHYTIDGSRPELNSPTLQDTVTLSKSTTIRAYVEGDSVTLQSPMVTGSYIMDDPHNIAVVNITINNADMYDYRKGIYSDGPGKSSEWPYFGANYWLNRIKPAHIEFFDGKGGFSYDCGFKIFGGYSRCEDKKSFCVKFRNNYGSPHRTYDFFGDGTEIEMNDLVLRSGSQDWNRVMIRDEFFTSLMEPECPELLIQKYRPIALYINMQYFGLYYLREKIDEHFVSRKMNVSSDSISIIQSKYLEQGSMVDYNKVMRYVNTKDMSQKENYEWVKNKVDVQGLIDFKLGEIYTSNTDVGNIRYVRSCDKNSDRKWHFVFYDLDASWVGYIPCAFYLKLGGKAAEMNAEVHNQLIYRLLKNKEFRKLFIQRLRHHIDKTFTPENTMKVFDKLIQTITPEMKRNCERWPKLSYGTWIKNVESFRSKLKNRNEIMAKDVRKELQITDQEWAAANRSTTVSAQHVTKNPTSRSAKSPSRPSKHQR